VAPARKDDPGELFPWGRLAKEGIGLWPERIESSLGPDALTRFGYDPDAPLDRVIIAFQRHFRPQKLDGKWDGECAGILSGLLRLIGSGRDV
jgi:N-acetylmuramoyl-L-alanine amidase